MALPLSCADYVRLMKYGDSLYRCKELKRAAFVRLLLPPLVPSPQFLTTCISGGCQGSSLKL